MLTDLSERDVSIHELVTDPGRLDRCAIDTCGMFIDFSKHLADDDTLSALAALAEECDINAKARQVYEGNIVNNTEERAALHMALRDPGAIAAVTDDFLATRQRIRELSEGIRSGTRTGPTGRKITDVINIGIGGSDLGPKMVCHAMREFADGPRCHFISNVDGAELLTLQKRLNPETTILLISSKSFTTTETLRNANTALAWVGGALDIENPEAWAVAITANTDNAIAFGIPETGMVTVDDTIGGRYSLWSAIGLAIAIAVGYERFVELLDGAAEMDQHFLESPAARNAPIMLGLLGVWYNNFHHVHSHAVVPYCERLGLLVNHLQQLDMESNGKSVTRAGRPVSTSTAPVIWGQTGTNGQHAFFQRLHQGTEFVPVDFIALANDNLSNTSHHHMLLANMIAQAEALMVGRHNEDGHRHHPGNRPSTTIMLDELTPRTLGALIALYEHRTFVQAAIWDINPFDQWGVELGKVLATSVLKGSTDHDPSTLNLMKRTGLLD